MAHEPPRVLIVGAVTRDLFGGAMRAGGAVSYAARTAAAMGQRLAILSGGGADAPRDALAGHHVAMIDLGATLTFEHAIGADGERRLRAPRRPARPLRAADLPPGWERARVLLLAPLLPDDIDLASFAGVAAPGGRSLLGQGLQRLLSPSLDVSHAPSPAQALVDACSPSTSLFLAAEEVAAWPPGALEQLADGCARVVLTRGAAGAEILHPGGGQRLVQAAPATPVDPTGAGDVFATAFTLALAQGEGEAAAARLAAGYAAAAVEATGPAPLPTRAQIERRLAAAAGVRQ